MKEFSQKDLDACLKAGFDKAFLDGNILRALNKERDRELVCESDGRSIKARVLHGTYPAVSAKSITEVNGNGYSPQYRFSTVGEAAERAICNPLY